MKLKTLSLAVLAAAICGWSAFPAAAQTKTTYAEGDLFIGFRALSGTGSGTNYLIKIGQASQFRDAAPGSSFTLSLGSIGIDLAGIYGGNWSARSDLLWSISGGNTSSSITNGGDPRRTGYYSNYEDGPAWNTHLFSGQQHNADFQSQWVRYTQTPTGGDVFSTVNSTVAIIQDASVSNSYGSFQVGDNQTSAYGNFGGGGENSFAVGGVAGTGTGLDLFRLETIASGGPASLPGELLGTFTIDNTGIVTFTAVPEPSVMALLGLSIAGFVVFALRRNPRSKSEA